MSIGTAKQIKMCGTEISLGDLITVEYTNGSWSKGSQIHGVVTELWDKGHLQARLSCGWCFHDNDKIVSHKKSQPVNVNENDNG